MGEIEEDLARVRASIRRAVLLRKCTPGKLRDHHDFVIPSEGSLSIYRNVYAFYQLSPIYCTA